MIGKLQRIKVKIKIMDEKDNLKCLNPKITGLYLMPKDFSDYLFKKKEVIHDLFFEYRDRSFEMWVEGSSYKKPLKKDIRRHAKMNGFNLKNIRIWYDNLEYFWRFNADLFAINKKAKSE